MGTAFARTRVYERGVPGLPILLGALAYVVRWIWRRLRELACGGALPGRRVGIQPEPGATPGRETLRSGCGDRRVGDRRHPRQWLLRNEIRAGPRVGDDRLSQIGVAVAAEIGAPADLGPELLRRVSSVARLAERHRMVRTQHEEQRSESDEQQHGARIVVQKSQACQAGPRNNSVEDVDSGG